MEITRPTVMEISLKNFQYNIEQIRKLASNAKLMPVIKANGYGTYINKNLEVIKNFDIVAVAIVDEAIELRKLGYTGEIFVLNQPSIQEISKIIDYDIIVGISCLEFLKEVNKKMRVHLEIETGMGRTGINLKDLENFIYEVKKNKNLEVEGIYSHLSSADFDEEYTKEQLKKFEQAKEIVEKNFDNIKYVHISASNGILNYKEGLYNLVRPGIIMYGYPSFEGAPIDIKPIAKLKSQITFIKEVEEGTSISYSRKFITNRKTKVATIPIGYADGIRRILTNLGEIVINEKRAPIIGTICMDSFMVDVTDIPDVNIGDYVFIWDNEIITLEEIARKCGTINYEILCTISDRVPRKFID